MRSAARPDASPVAAPPDPPDIAGDYTIDASHSRLGFVARHAMVTKVRGQFGTFEGTAKINTANPADSKVDLTIDVSSVDIRSADRDGHLTSGDLTIKDVTRSVTIAFEETGSARDPSGNLRIGLEGETTINRKDFGLVWNAALETGGVLVSEKIKLEFDVSAIRNV